MHLDPVFWQVGTMLHFSPGEVGKALRMSSVQVRAHVDAGNFEAFAIGDKPNAKYEHLRISRYSVLGWYFAHLIQRGTPSQFVPSPEAAAWRDRLLKAWKTNETPQAGKKA
jgi:hypothetical protein